MYKKCVTEHSAKRQREMELGLLKVMQTHRFEDITISDLCAMISVPRKAFYRYFTNKEGALYSLIDHRIMEFTYGSFAFNTQANLNTMIEFFAFWPTQKDLLDALARNDLSGILIQRSLVLAHMEAVYPKTLLASLPKHIREYALMFFVSGLMSLVIQWHRKGFIEPPEEMAQLAVSLLSQPLFVEKR